MRGAKLTSFLALAAIVCGIGVAQADEKSSKSDPQLARWLQQFPDSDANKDGVLTEAEALAHREKLLKTLPVRQALAAPDLADVPYGPHPRQTLDLRRAKSDRPTPLVIYIHGGGFVGGDKRTVSGEVVRSLLDAGVSVAAIHYRFVSETPFPAPQQDAARAVQFLRSKAREWNLDPTRFAAYGGSAGAGLSMWLAFHDDLADPQSSDPVARQSTRLACVGSFGGQSTYDPNVIKAWVGGRAHEHPSVFKCYAIESIDQIAEPRRQPLYDEVSAIKHLTKDDPPIVMFFDEPDGPLPADARPGQGIHHPVFGKKLKAAMDELKIEAVYRHRSEGNVKPDAELVAFLLKHLQAQRP